MSPEDWSALFWWGVIEQSSPHVSCVDISLIEASLFNCHRFDLGCWLELRDDCSDLSCEKKNVWTIFKIFREDPRNCLGSMFAGSRMHDQNMARSMHLRNESCYLSSLR